MERPKRPVGRPRKQIPEREYCVIYDCMCSIAATTSLQSSGTNFRPYDKVKKTCSKKDTMLCKIARKRWNNINPIDIVL
jgi:hypothetical protein